MFVGAFRKTIGLFLIAFGVGAVITLFMPLWLWVLIVAAVLMVLGFVWLICWKENNMKVVLYRPKGFMRFVLKSIFKI